MINLESKRALLSLGTKENVSMASVTTFHIGGPASFLLEADNSDIISRAIEICANSNYPLALIGNGSNILCPDVGFDGLIIKMKKSNTIPAVSENSFIAFAGDSLSLISNASVRNGFSGFERLAGIPGSIGGAIAMNAGAYGGEIIDVLKSVHILRNGMDKWVDAEHDLFGYRKSPFSWPGTIVLEAEFHHNRGDGSEIMVMEEYLRKRREKQPLEFPSAGSVFKRPAEHYAGQLIEEAGLKGACVNGAEVSPKHAGFIVNRGGATEKDVLTLIDIIQEKVFSLRGIHLERELLRLEEIVCTF